MKIRETCSCGATFQIDGTEDAVYVREWRRDHRCTPKPPEKGAVEATSGGQFELGFAPTGSEERA